MFDRPFRRSVRGTVVTLNNRDYLACPVNGRRRSGRRCADDVQQDLKAERYVPGPQSEVARCSGTLRRYRGHSAVVRRSASSAADSAWSWRPNWLSTSALSASSTIRRVGSVDGTVVNAASRCSRASGKFSARIAAFQPVRSANSMNSSVKSPGGHSAPARRPVSQRWSVPGGHCSVDPAQAECSYGRLKLPPARHRPSATSSRISVARRPVTTSYPRPRRRQDRGLAVRPPGLL